QQKGDGQGHWPVGGDLRAPLRDRVRGVVDRTVEERLERPLLALTRHRRRRAERQEERRDRRGREERQRKRVGQDQRVAARDRVQTVPHQQHRHQHAERDGDVNARCEEGREEVFQEDDTDGARSPSAAGDGWPWAWRRRAVAPLRVALILALSWYDRS